EGFTGAAVPLHGGGERELVADDLVGRGVAQRRIKAEAVNDRGLAGAAAVALVGGHPAGEDRGELRDIPLVVAAVDAERVQLHDFAAVVLVDLPGEALVLREIAEPGGAGGARREQIDEGDRAPARNGHVLVPLAAGLGLADPRREVVFSPEDKAVARG